MVEDLWNKIKELKITSFKDETGKVCWSFYYKDLKEILNSKVNKSMEKILVKWARNEEKLKKENRELKKELEVLRKMPTPEDFEEEFLKIIKKNLIESRKGTRKAKKESNDPKFWDNVLVGRECFAEEIEHELTSRYENGVNATDGESQGGKE